MGTVEEIRVTLKRWDDAYRMGIPEVSDAIFDQMYEDLRLLTGGMDPFLYEIRRVKITEDVVPHDPPMLSIRHTYEIDEVLQFADKLVGKYSVPYSFVIEPKMDGVSLSLKYDQLGKLVEASVRGDGYKGDNILPIVCVMDCIPKQLHLNSELSYYGIPIEVRGEVYMRKSEFREWNRSRVEKGSSEMANPRNAVAGTLMTLDPGIVKDRPLRFFPWALYSLDTLVLQDPHRFRMTNLSYLGQFHSSFEGPFKTREALEAKLREMSTIDKRDKSDFDMDGLVIKLDWAQDWEKIGSVGKCPRWCIAWKFEPRGSSSTLERVEWSVGRTGSITPLAHFKEVNVGGVKIGKASLCNMDEIQRLDIAIGDGIEVIRAGDVIPKIKSVHTRPENRTTIIMPLNCPECGTELKREEGKVAFKCTNFSCQAQAMARLQQMVGRSCLDLKGWGPEFLLPLLKSGAVKDMFDLFSLTPEKMSVLGLTPKRIEKLLTDVEIAKSGLTKTRFLLSLGIMGIGESLAKEMALHLISLTDLITATEEDLTFFGCNLTSIKGVQEFVTVPGNKTLLEKLNSVYESLVL